MSAEHLWIAPGEIVTDISGYVLLPGEGGDGFRVSSAADEGTVGSSDVPFDDPDGTFFVTGLNAYRIRETLSDGPDPYLWVGHFGSRTESRGDNHRDATGRRVTAQIQDINALLSRYVIRSDEDPKRPQETDTERMDWLLGTSAMDFLTLYGPLDETLIDTAGVTVSEADLTDYTPQQILDDMAQQSDRNYFVWWNGEDEAYQLVYARDTGSHLSSALRFSNDLADYDGDTTFYAGLDWELEHDPSRVTSRVTVRYAKGRVDDSDSGTEVEFGRVDRVMDASLVKSASVATNRAARYLADLDTEESTLTGTVYLPAAKASQFRAGMRAQFRATHLTGLSEFVWMRITEVTIVQVSEDPTLTYALAFTAIEPRAVVVSAPSFVGIISAHGNGLTIEPHEDTVEGDYMLLICGSRGSNSGPIASGPITGDGWVELPDSPQSIDINGDDQSARLTVFYKRHTGSQSPVSVAVSTGFPTMQARILSLRGVVPTSGNALNASNGGTEGLDFSLSIPGDTTTVDQVMVVSLNMLMGTLGTPLLSSWANDDLDDFTFTDYAASTDDQVLSAAWGVFPSAGTFGPTTATVNTSVCKAFMQLAFGTSE